MFFLVRATYESTARGHLAKHPEDREQVFARLIQKAGGELRSFFYAFGDEDVVAIVEAPDNQTAFAIELAASAPGHLRQYRTSPLMTSSEAMAAMKRAGSLSYKAPLAA
ncbi:MAG: GYD domain-containing protein [Planctomycetota bacterium]